MSTIFWVLVSDYKGLGDVIVRDIPEGQDADEVVDAILADAGPAAVNRGPWRRRDNIPVDEDFLMLFRELGAAADGPVRRNVPIRMTPEVRESVRRITAVSPGELANEFRMYILVGAQADLAPADEVATLAEANPEANRDYLRIRNMLAAQAPAERANVDFTALLRAYKVYGGAPPRLPYGDFPVGPDGAPVENCLVAALIDRYGDLPSGRRIARRSIEAWFDETAGGPSLARLKEFAVRYSIPLRVYDVLGAEIMALRHENAGNRSGNRPGFAMIAFNNHAYVTSKSLQSKPNFRPDQAACEIEGYFDSRASIVDPKTGNSLSDEETAVISSALHVGKPNFTYISEETTASCLIWEEPGTVHHCAEDCPCTNVGWDMNKAYYTAAMATRQSCPELAKYLRLDSIPVFSAMDDLHCVGDGTPIPPREKWPLTYFYIGEAALARLRGEQGHCAGRRSNLLTGVEFMYLVDFYLVGLDDVEGWKTASYSVPESAFRAWVDKLDPTEEPGKATTQRMFALINGLLGRSTTRTHMVKLVCPEEDVELLRAMHRDVQASEMPEDPSRMSVTVTLGAARHRYLNTRNFYNHVIGRMNLLMMQLVNEVARSNPDARLRKIKVDAVVYDRPIKLPDWAAPIFKRETPRLRGYAYQPVYLSAAKTSAGISEEIDAILERCTTFTGAPGTGKTTKVLSTMEYDVALAFSNVCARNLDRERDGEILRGRTLHDGLGLYTPELREEAIAGLRGKTLWIDEFSTVQSWVWSVIVNAIVGGAKFCILTGDPNQTPPVMERFRRESLLMRKILDKSTHLTEDHRNDAPLVKLRSFVEGISEVDAERKIPEFIGAYLKKYPGRSADSTPLSDVNVHITHTNRVRIAINYAIAKARSLQFTAESADAGLRLRAKVTRKSHEIYKGAVYELMTQVSRASRHFTVRRIYLDVDRAPDVDITLPIKEFAGFELGYALTAHSAIGQTVRGQKMAIHEIGSMARIDKSIFYVAITRACRLDDILFGLGTHPDAAAVEKEALAKDAARPRPPLDDEAIFDGACADFCG